MLVVWRKISKHSCQTEPIKDKAKNLDGRIFRTLTRRGSEDITAKYNLTLVQIGITVVCQSRTPIGSWCNRSKPKVCFLSVFWFLIICHSKLLEAQNIRNDGNAVSDARGL